MMLGDDETPTMVIPIGGRVLRRPKPPPLKSRRSGLFLAVVGALTLGLLSRPAGDAPGPARLQLIGLGEVMPPRLAEIDRVLMARRADLTDGERQAVARAIVEESDHAGYDPFLVLGLIAVESDFRHEAVSSVGAYGLMQIRPDTLAWVARRNGVNLPPTLIARDPALCVRLGVRYLKQLHDQFHSMDMALMAYNAGPNKVAALAAQRNNALEPYFGYVKAVHREREALRAQETAVAVAQR